MKLHPYTESVMINIKWFIKRCLNTNNSVDNSIQIYLRALIGNGTKYNRGLNVGAGYYTPIDIWMKKITPNIIHLDTTSLVKLFRPLTGKVIKLDDGNFKFVIEKFNSEVIYCFHSFSFIQLDWLAFTKFCSNYEIKLIFDWSIRPSVELNEGVNKFCVEPNAQNFFSHLLENGYKIMDLESHEQISNIKFIREDKRFLVSNF